MGAYYVIDKTGGRLTAIVEEEYGRTAFLLTHLIGTEEDLPKSCDGDAFVIRDLAIAHGLVFGKDFYIRKCIPPR